MTFQNPRAPAGHRICRQLRCKEMFYVTAHDLETGRTRVTDVEEDGHVYWCARTCRGFGPSGLRLGLDACGPQRGCYEPAGPEPRPPST